MGQEGSVPTLQLTKPASVIANGGLLVRPRLVSNRGGETLPVAAPVRILRPQTAITMRQMMEGVVINPQGTGRRAKLAGYSVGGKTGSAQIFDFATKHYTHSYNGTFMGYTPPNRRRRARPNPIRLSASCAPATPSNCCWQSPPRRPAA